jgi:phosphate transport system ATP-binding protein
MVSAPSPREPQPKIVVENLSVQYRDGTESLRGISIQIPANQITVLFGPAGGGKSTLLRAFNRLNDLADGVRMTGTITLDGEDVRALDPVSLRRRVGMVFAQPVPLPMSVRQNIWYGLELAGVRDGQRKEDALERSLQQAALWEEVKDRLDDSALQLSGGQQQRLCIARALATNPDVLLMDEPASALDPASTARIEDLIFELRDRYTIVIVTHNMQQAARVSDLTEFFYHGELIEAGSTNELFTNPARKQTEDYITGRFG